MLGHRDCVNGQHLIWTPGWSLSCFMSDLAPCLLAWEGMEKSPSPWAPGPMWRTGISSGILFQAWLNPASVAMSASVLLSFSAIQVSK